MHGRVKIRTTAEQDELKRKERQKKVAKYLFARHAIIEKRKSTGIDAEALQMITAVLTTIPDFGTLWNWRREGFTNVWKDMPSDELQQKCHAELLFLNQCLQHNPKSYGVWHQRRWVMGMAPSPPWEEELDNCNKFLKLDERNFHCWDYRRFVVRHSHTASAEEFEFSMGKISENFSNYSAWHYRSTLLAKVRPADAHAGSDDEDMMGMRSLDRRAVAAGAIDEELDTVASAFYIDPCDQSAWFYHRWLLGREETQPTVCCAHVGNTDRMPTPRIMLVFSHAVFVDTSKIHVTIHGEDSPVGVAWTAIHAETPQAPSVTWQGLVETTETQPAAEAYTIHLATGAACNANGIATCATQATSTANATAQYNVSKAELRSRLSRYQLPSPALLQGQLSACRELLEELEEGYERKWALLAIIYILQGLNPVAHHSDIIATLHTLKAIDPQRKGYYADIMSRAEWESMLFGDAGNDGEAKPLLPIGHVNMASKSLTSLHHLAHFFMVETLNLSDNHIVRLSKLQCLQTLRKLVLDDNAILGVYDTELSGLPGLRDVSLRNNDIKSCRGLQGLKGLPLEALCLTGNPVCKSAEFPEFATEFLPYLVE
eukprot:m.578112 g.578112  ORF g.578112 m.578112 type:complete len:601 (+) comp22304_c0_seq1:597-2399(+)